MQAYNTIKYESPIGSILLVANGGFITGLYFDANAPAMFSASSSLDCGVLKEATRQLDAYFSGTLQKFDLPIAAHGTPFRMSVWQELQRIPYGATISYKALANNIGNPRAIRAVGGANHHNPVSIIIPCHRVVGANGKLVGYGGGLHVKEFLLAHEASNTLQDKADLV